MVSGTTESGSSSPCVRCGAELLPGAQFCMQCGRKVVADTANDARGTLGGAIGVPAERKRIPVMDLDAVDAPNWRKLKSGERRFCCAEVVESRRYTVPGKGESLQDFVECCLLQAVTHEGDRGVAPGRAPGRCNTAHTATLRLRMDVTGTSWCNTIDIDITRAGAVLDIRLISCVWHQKRGLAVASLNRGLGGAFVLTILGGLGGLAALNMPSFESFLIISFSLLVAGMCLFIFWILLEILLNDLRVPQDVKATAENDLAGVNDDLVRAIGEAGWRSLVKREADPL